MLRSLGCWLIGIVALSTSQGFLAILQIVAWVTMFYDNSREETLEVALARTFSGEYACEMCVYVAQVQSKESSVSLTETIFKNLLPLTGISATRVYKLPAKISTSYQSFLDIPPDWIISPEDPPPRCIAVLSALV
jgi:hypothetical protein